MKLYYTYLTTNLITGEQYVGQHKIAPHERKYYLGSGLVFKRAVKKYGCNNFFKEILEWFDTAEQAHQAESHYIQFHNTHISQGGYNISKKGGLFCSGESLDEEIKAKLRKPKTEQAKAAMRRAQGGKNNPRYGVKEDKDHAYKRTEPLRGKKRPKEVGIRISKAKKGRSNGLEGSKFTEEHKRKIGNGNKGKTRTKETIERARISHLGHKPTIEQLDNNCASQILRKEREFSAVGKVYIPHGIHYRKRKQIVDEIVKKRKDLINKK